VSLNRIIADPGCSNLIQTRINWLNSQPGSPALIRGCDTDNIFGHN